eukprot:TRINITY_DN1524_c0_g1_i1.p1 TRINITY_DN1524_c0_g1~~TRINITY_DN1524_c0_g1_i1.p1  ORF type:complete len:198 (-),score=55.81 TRINITY_DN1524_c0_g1_i1:697-1290(-)
MRLSSTGDWKRQADDLAAALRQYHKDGLDMVFCAAGGWQGGGMKDKGVLASAEAMWEVNARTALVSAHVASSMLNDDGMLVLTGAQAALQPTPGMIGYGMAKVATAHLCASIAADPAIKWRCSAILPNIIDTPANQDAMGHYIHDDWTPPEKIAEKLVEWLRDPAQRPPSGAMVSVSTLEGITTWDTGRLRTELVPL